MTTYEGKPLITAQQCDHPAADCLHHTFGLSAERADAICGAVEQHARACSDREAGTVDFVRFMNGPLLDLATPQEAMAYGYVMHWFRTEMLNWLMKHKAKQAKGQVSDIVKNMKGDGFVVMEVGPNGARVVASGNEAMPGSDGESAESVISRAMRGQNPGQA